METTIKLVSESELDVGLAHAKRKHDVFLDRDMLRSVTNETLQRKNPASRLALLASKVVREYIPSRTKEMEKRINGYKSAVMKICSDRAARKRQKLATTTSPTSPVREEYPADKAGQYRLI